ncbi:MAG TPA: hypothetical protein VGG05_02975 [Pseudonocardiaceae bacterium]|jgi:bilirubin oxidase
MPPTAVLSDHLEYQVAERRFAAQVLPAGMPTSVVNGYGNPHTGSTFHSPSFTIENTANKQTRVTWMNQMTDTTGRFLPPLFTTDPTIHWANPPGGTRRRRSAAPRRPTPGRSR